VVLNSSFAGLDMHSEKPRQILYYGLLFVVLYLYSYEATFTTLRVSTPCAGDHQWEYRAMPDFLFKAIYGIEAIIEMLSVPSITIAERIFGQLDFCWEYVVFFPFFVAPQWFVYGCVVGWLRYRRKESRAKRSLEGNR
jgi:hypothetical protein